MIFEIICKDIDLVVDYFKNTIRRHDRCGKWIYTLWIGEFLIEYRLNKSVCQRTIVDQQEVGCRQDPEYLWSG